MDNERYTLGAVGYFFTISNILLLTRINLLLLYIHFVKFMISIVSNDSWKTFLSMIYLNLECSWSTPLKYRGRPLTPQALTITYSPPSTVAWSYIFTINHNPLPL